MDEQAAAILEEAETKLAQRAGELVAARQMTEAKPLLRLIDELAALREGEPELAPAKPGRRQPARTPSTSSSRKTPYPKFARDGDTLVKIGYSRREKKEYEHRSPLAALDAVATHAARVADRQGRFTSDDLMPVPDADGDDLPSYQSYLCLAFLRDQGLVLRDGRSQYRIASPKTLAVDARTAAAKLRKHASG